MVYFKKNYFMNDLIKNIYTKCFFKISDFITETESKKYNACQFKINNFFIISRTSKITPKKIGQFVTFWKRNKAGITEPFHQNDSFNFYVINAQKDKKIGQFIFPKSELIKQGIISTHEKDGKRGFRVYPSWDKPNNKQAEKTQQWQLKYFFEINNSTDLNRIKKLYQNE